MKRSRKSLGFRQKVNEIGRKMMLLIAEGGDPKIRSRVAAVDALVKWVKKNDGPQVDGWIRDAVREAFADWMKRRSADAAEAGSTDPDTQLLLEVLGDVPLTIEISPGRKMDTIDCNRKQLHAAVRQAEVKRNNSDTYYQRLRDAEIRLLPHLTNDDITVREAFRSGREAAGS